MKLPLLILHLEDDPNDAELIRLTLESEGITCVPTRVQSLADFDAALEREDLDLILADYSLPDFDGLLALSIAREKRPDLPFILVSGTVGEETAIESLKNGATDYVLKGRLSKLATAVRRAILEAEGRVRRERAERDRKVYSRRLQELSRRLVEAQETERRHIARELHDQVGQALTVAQLNLQALLRSPAGEARTARLKDTLAVVEQVLDQVRDLSLELRPSLLDDLGLVPALRWYTERQASLTGLHFEVQADLLERRPDPLIETECFRIAQEALTNVLRHAKARNVTVEVRVEEGKLHLRVRDDGVGFGVAAVREQVVRGTSLGLLSMEERAALARGELEFNSAPGRGTEVHAWFPLEWRSTRIRCKTDETSDQVHSSRAG
jgi:signal transduction histidine kinase